MTKRETRRGSKGRPGYAALPRTMLQGGRLGFEHLGLLLYLASHDSDWIVRLSDVQKKFRIGEEKLGRLLRELDDWGYITRKKARQKGHVAGLRITVHAFDLNPENPGLDPAPNPRKPEPCISGSIKDPNKERALNSDVIDVEDAGPFPASRSVPSREATEKSSAEGSGSEEGQAEPERPEDAQRATAPESAVVLCIDHARRQSRRQQQETAREGAGQPVAGRSGTDDG